MDSSSTNVVMGDLSQRRKQLKHQISTVDSWRSQAVCVRKACKSYGRRQNTNVILDGLNMTVAKNTIYGLLGASGCGKTTLLSCIVGRKQLDSGEVWVLGGRPGSKASGIPGSRIGYMPQEISLYGEFTIRETCLYFGWITGMTTKDIDDKLDFLTEFLQLPSKNAFVRDLSGGQQRRVSLSAALIHDPELLILDEPTVGVDPILRHSIWQYLVDITKNGNTTIILTTHYIDEMKQADCIGLMRGGYFLAEDSPQNLMEQLETDNLEDAYLKLSVIQNKDRCPRRSSISEQVVKSVTLPQGIVNTGLNIDEDQHCEISGEFGDNVSMSSHTGGRRMSLVAEDKQLAIPPEDLKQMNCLDYMRVLNGKHLGALIWKHFLWMWRNKASIAFMILLPLFQISVFTFAIGGNPKEIIIAVSNHELQNWNMECPFQRGCNATYLSCRYLKHLEEHNLILKNFESDDLATAQVDKGKAYASLTFAANYSEALLNRIDLGRKVSDADIDNSIVSIYQDKSNQQISLLLWKDFHYIFLDYIQEFMMDCHYPKEVVDVPIRFNKPIYGESEPNYTDFAAPGAVLTMAFFLAMAVTAGGLIIERNEGIFERSTVAGVSEVEILLSHVIADFFIVLAQVLMLLLVTFGIIALTNEGSMTTVFFLTILTGISGMAFGYFISCFCENEQSATVIALGTFFPMIMLCGMIWPREAMYYPLQILSNFLPLTFNTEGMRAILQRGWGIHNSLVYQGFLYTFGWTVLFLVLNVLLLKIKKK